MPGRILDAIRSRALFALPAAYTLQVPKAILGVAAATLLLAPLVFYGPVNSPESSEPAQIPASEVDRVDEGLTGESQELWDSRATVVLEIDTWSQRLRALSAAGPVEVSGLVDSERRQRIAEAERQVVSAEEVLGDLNERLSSLETRWNSAASSLGFWRCQYSSLGVFCSPLSVDPAIFAASLLVASILVAMFFSGDLWSKIPDEREQYLPYARYTTWPFGAYLLALVCHLLPPVVLHTLLNHRLGADYALAWLNASSELFALSAWVYILWVTTILDWGMRTRRAEAFKSSVFVTVLFVGLVGYSVGARPRSIDLSQDLTWLQSLADYVPYSPTLVAIAVCALLVTSALASELGRYLLRRGLFLLLATVLLLVVIAGEVTTWDLSPGYGLALLIVSTTFSVLYVASQRLSPDYNYPIRVATDENPFQERVELLFADTHRSLRGLFGGRHS